MRVETGERWRKLCERAAAEPDPQKLMELVAEINQLLERKEERAADQDADRPPAAQHPF